MVSKTTSPHHSSYVPIYFSETPGIDRVDRKMVFQAVFFNCHCSFKGFPASKPVELDCISLVSYFRFYPYWSSIFFSQPHFMQVYQPQNRNLGRLENWFMKNTNHQFMIFYGMGFCNILVLKPEIDAFPIKSWAVWMILDILGSNDNQWYTRLVGSDRLLVATYNILTSMYRTRRWRKFQR